METVIDGCCIQVTTFKIIRCWECTEDRQEIWFSVDTKINLLSSARHLGEFTTKLKWTFSRQAFNWPETSICNSRCSYLTNIIAIVINLLRSQLTPRRKMRVQIPWSISRRRNINSWYPQSLCPSSKRKLTSIRHRHKIFLSTIWLM